MPDSPAVTSDRIDAYVWRISAVVIVGSIMSILDTTIVNVALDTLGRELHSTISNIQWVVTGLSALAIVPCLVLMRAERAVRRAKPAVSDETMAEALAA